MKLGTMVNHEYAPAVHGEIIGVRPGEVNVRWHLARPALRLVATGNPESPYRAVVENVPYTTTFFHPFRFLEKGASHVAKAA